MDSIARTMTREDFRDRMEQLSDWAVSAALDAKGLGINSPIFLMRHARMEELVHIAKFYLGIIDSDEYNEITLCLKKFFRAAQS